VNDEDWVDDGPVAVATFRMDEPYLLEFHAEMVATRLPRWRFHRRVALGSAGLGVLLSVWAASTGRTDAGVLAAIVLVGAAALLFRLRRRRERWLSYQRRLPHFGALITTALDRGRLVQSSDRGTDVLAIPTGEVVESPQGWFVTYDTVRLGTEVTDASVSTARASAYLPHRSFEPPLSRDALAAELAHGFTVRRSGGR
jgi:hypothetical protein